MSGFGSRPAIRRLVKAPQHASQIVAANALTLASLKLICSLGSLLCFQLRHPARCWTQTICRGMNKLLTILFLIVYVSASGSDEKPFWEQLTDTIGLDISEYDVRKIVAMNYLEKMHKGSSGSFSAPDHSFALLFRQGEIRTVIFQITTTVPEFGVFTHELPCGIKRDFRIEDFTNKFGKSHTKQGHSWKSSGLNIWVHFSEDGSFHALYVRRDDQTAKGISNRRR